MGQFDRDGMISYGEFVEFVFGGDSKSNLRQTLGSLGDRLKRDFRGSVLVDIRRAFRRIDRDGQDSISRREFEDVLDAMGAGLSQSELREVVHALGGGGDRRIRYMDF